MVDEAAEWHLLRGKAQTGPFPLAKVLETMEQNLLQKTDHVWRHGWPEWRLASSVPELFSDADAFTPAGAAPASGAAAPSSAARGTNYIVRHWRGDLSLPMSFWVNGILVTIGLNIMSTPIAGVVATVLGAAGSSTVTQIVVVLAILLFLAVLGMAVMVWQGVGMWRSASKHRGRGGYLFWAIVVKLLIVLWFGSIVIGLAAALVVFAMGGF